MLGGGLFAGRFVRGRFVRGRFVPGTFVRGMFVRGEVLEERTIVLGRFREEVWSVIIFHTNAPLSSDNDADQRIVMH